jgi:hypothetical protein
MTEIHLTQYTDRALYVSIFNPIINCMDFNEIIFRGFLLPIEVKSHNFLFRAIRCYLNLDLYF